MVKELVSYCNKNKGMKLTDLKKFLKQNNLDFDINYITKEFWWFLMMEKIKKMNMKVIIFL